MVLAGACSSAGPDDTCDADTIRSVLAGNLVRGGQTKPVRFEEVQTKGTLEASAIDFLSGVLGRGKPTGTGSAVWGMAGSGGTDGVIMLQMAGSRAAATSLPIAGALLTGLPWGEGPAVSAVFPNAVAILYATDDFRAIRATGTLRILTAAPLTASLDAILVSMANDTIHIAGQVSVVLSGPGCH